MAEVLSTVESLHEAGIDPYGGSISLAQSLRMTGAWSLRTALLRLRANSPAAFRAQLPADAILLSITLEEIYQAVKERIAGTNQPTTEKVVWARGSSEMVVGIHCTLQATGGYLRAHFHAETTETGPIECQLVFFLGTAEIGSGKAASVSHTLDAPEFIVDAWGDALRTVVWEGLLDVIEGATIAACQLGGGIPLRLLGFTGGENRVLLALGI